MASIADLLPSNHDLVKNYEVHVGDVIKIFDTIAKKEKWHLIVGFDNENVLTATVRINSEINPHCVPPNLRRYHFFLKQEEYSFLIHNSFVDCSTLIVNKKTDLEKHVTSNQGKLLGHIEGKKLDNIRVTIAECHTVSPKQKKIFGLN